MYAALWIPAFRLQAAMRWRDLPPAVALIDASVARGVILEVSAAAGASGVQAGLTSAQGLARCPGLHLLPRAPAQEDACNALLVEVALRFSPRVEATAAGMVLVDLRAATRAACWQKLGESVVECLAAENLTARAGFSRHPDHALLAARSASPVAVVYDGVAFCAGLPVSALEPDAALATILDDWGIRTVGEFMRLPKTQLIERLGSGAERLWRRASGRGRRVLRLVAPVEVYREAFDFEAPIDTTQPLLFLLRRFLDSLCARLREAHRVVSAMRIALPMDDASTYAREFSVPAPTSDVDVLHRILDTHLETLHLDAQPVGVRLELTATDPRGHQLALFERSLRDPNGLGFTLARLQAIVGADGVGVPQPADSHRPGAFVLQPFAESVVDSAIAPPALGLPLRRLRPPPPVRVRTHDGEPAWLDSADWSGPVRRAGGPYRVSSEWWHAAAWGLEEWDVELEGRGLLRIARQRDGWTVEGTYDVR